jgi:hypothetical protein
MKEFYAEIDDHLKEYESGTITISEDIEFSMRQTVRQITRYIMSKYMGGQNDEQGRRKPFRNIGNAIVDLEWRAKNIDRKSIEAEETDGDYIFSLIVNKEVQQWMKVNNFGKTIDDYQRKKSEYGSGLLKKTETATELLIEPVKWEHTAVDPRDITNGTKIEKNYLSPLELKAKKGVWTEQTDGELSIDMVIEAAQKLRKSTCENRIEVLDIEGQFEKCVLYETAEGADDDDTIGLYNVIVAVVKNKKYCLYKTELTESRFKHFKRKETEGCDFGVGVWQEIFEPQIWTNEAVIAEKVAMDLAGKVALKTNKKDLPSGAALLDGEVIELDDGQFLESLQLMPSALPGFQNQVDNWFANMQRDQSAYPGVTGEEPKASTPFQSLALQASQSGSIFNKRRDQDGYDILEVLIDWVIPFIIKKINNKHTLTASYSSGELQQLDQAIVADHANNSAKQAILSVDASGPLHQPLIPSPISKEVFASQKQQGLSQRGNKRDLYVPKGYITLAKVKQKLRFNITDEMQDSQRELNGLATTLQSLAPGDPERTAIIQRMMELSGSAPASYPAPALAPAPAATPSPTKPTRVNQALPAGQQ